MRGKMPEQNLLTRNHMKNKYKHLPIYQAPDGWVVKYKKFYELADEQMHTFWPWDEPLVENDLQDLRTNLTEAEMQGIVTVLKLFTLYEMRVGEDYWSSRIAKTFKRPEIQRMASMFSAVEFNSHAPFYNKINEILYLDTEEFYAQWKQTESLRNRIEFVAQCAGDPDDLLSIAAFSFIEGAVLYSSFAFIKHFQAQECGKDLLKNICRGVDQSMCDENLHSVGGAELFKQIRSEAIAAGMDVVEVDSAVRRMAETVLAHEVGIIRLIFNGNRIKGITEEDLVEFVKQRLNICLEQLGYEALYKLESDSVAKWFYKNTTGRKLHDFFVSGSAEYNINWKESRFGEVWK